LRVFLMDGRQLASVPLEEVFDEAFAVRTLKRRLQSVCGVPRFRQRLLCGNEILEDSASLSKPLDLHLILLPFCAVPLGEVEQIVTAARSGQVSEVESLLQQPQHPDPELLDARGHRRGSALAVASSQGHVEIVSLLLEAGADKHRDFGTASLTAIGEASRHGHAGVVRLLLENRMETWQNRESELHMALSLATINGHVVTFCLLLDARANIHMKTQHTPEKGLLGEACTNGHYHIVRLLLAEGADKNKVFGAYGGTPLGAASVNGHSDVVRALVEAHADCDRTCGLSPDSRSRDWTPLGAAIRLGSLRTTHILLKARADVNKPFGVYGETPLGTASVYGHAQLVRLLLEAGANKDDEFGFCANTPLGTASTSGDVEIVAILLEARADVDRKFGGRESPMLLGSHLGDGVWQMSECDRASGDLNEQIKQRLVGWTPLGAAVRAGHSDVVTLLLQKRADQDMTFGMYGDTHNTPLGAAIAHGQKQCEHLLLQAGADKNRTLALYAPRHGFQNLELLRSGLQADFPFDPRARGPLLHLVRSIWGCCLRECS